MEDLQISILRKKNGIKEGILKAFDALGVDPPSNYIEKAKKLEVGEITTHADGSKWVKQSDGSIVPYREPKAKKKEEKTGEKNGKKTEEATGKKPGAEEELHPDAKKNLENHASKASDEELNRAIKESKDPNVVNVARAELDKRKKGGNDNGGDDGDGGDENDKNDKKSTGKKGSKSKGGKSEKKEREPQWFDDLHKKHSISPLPVGIPESDVEVYKGKDTDSHWIMKWKDPKSGYLKNAYTKEFHEKNAKIKWERTAKLGGVFLKDVSKQSKNLMMNGKTKKERDLGAIMLIMSKTGLRVGNSKSLDTTGNQGVTTLLKESVKVKGNVVTLDFIGKSYKQNVNKIDDKDLAEFLSSKVEGAKDGSRIFSVDREAVMKSFRSDLGYRDQKLKDLRTVVACEEASKFLSKHEPFDMPKNKVEARKKIKEILKGCFDHVSTQLNNTPSMAEKSYVNPYITETWLDKIGATDLFKAETDDKNDNPLDTLIARSGVSTGGNISASPDYLVDDGDIDTEPDDESYPLPDWWDKEIKDTDDPVSKAVDEVDFIKSVASGLYNICAEGEESDTMSVIDNIGREVTACVIKADPLHLDSLGEHSEAVAVYYYDTIAKGNSDKNSINMIAKTYGQAVANYIEDFRVSRRPSDIKNEMSFNKSEDAEQTERTKFGR